LVQGYSSCHICASRNEKIKKVKQFQKISGNSDAIATSLSKGGHTSGIMPNCLAHLLVQPFAGHVNILYFRKPFVHITNMNTKLFKYLEFS